MAPPLSVADLERLKREPYARVRAELTEKMCRQFDAGQFKDKEIAIIQEILEYLSRDVEVKIRRIIAETLKENPNLPHSVALRLAKDIEEVAAPILEFSSVLTAEDLIEIIRATNAVAKLAAIARRQQLPGSVADSLIEKRHEKVTLVLLANEKVKLTDAQLKLVVSYFQDDEDVLGMMIGKGHLNAALAEKIVGHVSVQLQKELTTRYGITPGVAREAGITSGEKATLDLVSAHLGGGDIETLIDYLHKSGKLSHSIVLRALCKGDLAFFTAGMARLADIPLVNAKKLIHEGDTHGFTALFRAASMPYTLLEATEKLLQLILQEAENREDVMHFRQRMVERIVEEGYDQNIPNMRYLMTLIGSTAAFSNT